MNEPQFGITKCQCMYSRLIIKVQGRQKDKKKKKKKKKKEKKTFTLRIKNSQDQ